MRWWISVHPANPVVHANVSDLLSWDIFNPDTCNMGNNGRFYVADGTGGFGVYNASPSGGPELSPLGSRSLSISTIRLSQQQTLYAAAVYGSGAGGLACFDVSGGTPNLLGSLIYSNDSSFAAASFGHDRFPGTSGQLEGCGCVESSGSRRDWQCCNSRQRLGAIRQYAVCGHRRRTVGCFRCFNSRHRPGKSPV